MIVSARMPPVQLEKRGQVPACGRKVLYKLLYNLDVLLRLSPHLL